MKKVIVTVLGIVTAMTLVACGRPQKLAVCTECFQEKMCKEYMVTGIFGDKDPMMICDDCIKNARELAKMWGMKIE